MDRIEPDDIDLRDTDLRDDGQREADLLVALSDLSVVQMETPAGLAERVLAAFEAEAVTRRRAARLAVIRARERAWGAGRRSVTGVTTWSRRNRALCSGALASSAVVVGAVAIGLETRRVRRSRQERAA